MTREQIVQALSLQERESVAYWDALDLATFFQPIGSSWSPAETVRHLVKSNRMIATAFGMPSLLLRLKFGRSARASLGYDEFVALYLDALRKGGNAGRYAPSPRKMDDLDVWRVRIMNDFVRGQHDIRRRVAAWSEDHLDRLCLPHPLLGPITMREMAYFVHYHQRHHLDVVQRNLTTHRSSGGQMPI